MKTLRILNVLLLTIGLLLVNVSPALALPPLPSSFWGTVKIDGANVTDGTQVSAHINGVQYAVMTVETYLEDTVYFFDLPGDDPATPGVIEGGVAGDTVVFYIGSIQAYQTAPWAGGTDVELNLTNGYALTVSKSGTGSGMVTSLPTGIDCGATCSDYFDDNTSVTLTATAATGSTFTGWVGACSGTGSCVVTMSVARSVTATFTLTEYTLTITSAHGTVVKNPNQATYHYGDVVQLTATPSAGWNFSNWFGDASGTANPVSVTVNGNKAFTANYTPIRQ